MIKELLRRHALYFIILLALFAALTALLIFLSSGPQEGPFTYIVR